MLIQDLQMQNFIYLPPLFFTDAHLTKCTNESHFIF